MQQRKKVQIVHIVSTVLALLILISFFMPMFTITAWKNVGIKNGVNGNGITMLEIGSNLSKSLESVIRKAKLPDGVTSSIAEDAISLRTAGILMLIGFIMTAALFLIMFTENLGIDYGKKRKALVSCLCIATALCLVITIFLFTGFNQNLQAAANNANPDLEKVTSKLLQDGQPPILSVGVYAYLALAGLLAQAVMLFLPTDKKAFRRSLLWFTLPALILYSCFVILPALSSIYLGFTSYDGITRSAMRFIGLDNYKTIFTSARFAAAMGNTLIIAASFTVLVNIFALMLAIMVDKVRFMKNLFRSAFYLPVLISGIIAGFIWRIMYNYSFGIINFILNSVGLNSVKFIDTMPNALLSIIFVLLWKQVGYYMIIYLAALQGISQDLLEAASIDGANGRQSFRHITLPLLAGSFTINLTLALINGLKVFDEIAVLTDGGPGFSTETITYMVYKVAFGEMRQGYGTAMAVILFLIILVLGGVQSTVLRKKEVQM